MAVQSCDPNDLAEAARCFECLTEQQRSAIQTFLLAVIAGGSVDPNVLGVEAAAFTGLTEQQRQAIDNFLLCQIANAA